MCGFLVSSLNNCSHSLFETSLEFLDHRGPDETKLLSNDDFHFGFKRLSIQDLTPAGSQPMQDEKGNVLCFNGEIYNFQSIKQELQQYGIQFISRSDTEVILRALDFFGMEKTLDKLDGMYAIAYFEASSSKMFIIRDPFGMKPLFYYIKGSTFICASEIKAINSLNESTQINKHASLNPLFFNGMPPKNETLFEGVFSLSAGTVLEFHAKTKVVSSRSFCDLKTFVNEETFKENSQLSRSELTEKFGQTFESSVKYHLLSDAPVAIMFSAGLDSSLVAATVSKLSEDNKTLFKYQAEEVNDDSLLATEFAKEFELELSTTQNIDSTLISRMPHLIYAYETINKADGLPLSSVCRDAKKRGYKVMLTGDSADELWGGYGSLTAFRIHQAFANSKFFNNVLSTLNKFLPGVKNSASDSLHHLASPFDVSFLKPFIDFGLFKFERESEWKTCRDAYSFLENDLKQSVNGFLLDELTSRLERFMVRSDRVGMSESIELRLPFLTKKMAQLAVNLPFEKKSFLSPSLSRRTLFWDKAPVRDYAKNLGVTPSIIQRAKIGTPSGQAEFDNLIHTFRILGCANVASLFNIYPDTIYRYIEGVQNEALLYRLVWNFLSMEIFIRLFFENISPYTIEDEINVALRKI